MVKLYSKTRGYSQTQTIKKDDDISMDEDKLHDKMQELDDGIRFGRAKNVVMAGGHLTAKLVPMKHTPLTGGSFLENVMSGGTIMSKKKEKNRNNLRFVI